MVTLQVLHVFVTGHRRILETSAVFEVSNYLELTFLITKPYSAQIYSAFFFNDSLTLHLKMKIWNCNVPHRIISRERVYPKNKRALED